ncbi:MAG: hypothetical protein COA58_00565 [Bacteroidetes bacterium]|nr:MAG: hypothetical protein COA58_00565 [Bacteroidota bacterium]
MNRGFLYGDGFFETIRVIDGQIPLVLFHIDRIEDALEIYDMTAQFEITSEFIKGMVHESQQNGILRINFFRDGGGKYLGESDLVAFNHTFNEYNEPFFLPISLDLEADLTKAPKSIGTWAMYSEPKPNVSWMTVKSLSSMYYVLAAKQKMKLGTDYLFIQNDKKEICEELVSNLLLQIGDEIIIPARSSGGIIGSTLRYLLATYGFQLTERIVTLEDIENANSVYCCKGSTGVTRIK